MKKSKKVIILAKERRRLKLGLDVRMAVRRRKEKARRETYFK